MSEHIVALVLAAAKRLLIEHANLKSGEFNQRSTNRMLRGMIARGLGLRKKASTQRNAGSSRRTQRLRSPERPLRNLSDLCVKGLLFTPVPQMDQNGG